MNTPKDQEISIEGQNTGLHRGKKHFKCFFPVLIIYPPIYFYNAFGSSKKIPVMFTEQEYNLLTSKIICSAIEVHRELGPGLMESVYEVCLRRVLQLAGLQVECRVVLPVCFKGERLDKEFIIDLLVEDRIIVELKSVENLLPVHEAQLLTYLKLSGKKLGLLINFNVAYLKEGVRRKINGTLNYL